MDIIFSMAMDDQLFSKHIIYIWGLTFSLGEIGGLPAFLVAFLHSKLNIWMVQKEGVETVLVF